jgi:hypothetical protein
MAILVGDNDSEILVGRGGADTIRGNGGNDTLLGLGGNDRIEGGVGSDRLFGGAGHDRLFGGAGGDVLVGGLGRDFLSGGAGADTFRFDDKDAGDATNGPLSDVILDLGAGDVIDLLAVDVVTASPLGGLEPERGTFSLTLGGDGGAYITWNTFGGYHDIEVQGVTDLYDLYWNHIRWYVDDNYGGFGTTVTIGGNETRHGTIENGSDEDWFRLDVRADRLYTFTIAGEDGARQALPTPALDLVDEEGFGVEHVHDELTFYAQEAGTYYLRVGNDDFGTAGSYEFVVESVAYEDDYGDWNDASRGKLAAGGSRTGNIGHVNDEDAFAFKVEAGKTYTIDVRGASSKAGTLVDPYVVIDDQSGTYVWDDTDGGKGADARAAFTAWETATYTATVFAENFGETGTYEITLAVEDSLLAA